MLNDVMNEFAKQIILQTEINRTVHDDRGAESVSDVGHLAAAVRKGKLDDVHKELLHIGGPLYEMYFTVTLNREINYISDSVKEQCKKDEPLYIGVCSRNGKNRTLTTLW